MRAAALLVFALLGISLSICRPAAARVSQQTVFASSIFLAQHNFQANQTGPLVSQSRHHEAAFLENAGYAVVRNPQPKQTQLPLLGLVGLGSLVAGLIMKR
jgi:hypothetical protein